MTAWTPYPDERRTNGANMNITADRVTSALHRMRATELADDLDSFLVEAKDDPDIRPLLVHASQLAMAIRQYAKR